MLTIDELQKIDPISVAEKLLGKDSKDDESVGWLGMALAMDRNQKLNALMDSTDDTKFNESEPEYLRKVTDFGFRTILLEPFTTEEGIEERFYVMWHDGYSILLVWDTFTYGDDGSWAKADKEVPLSVRNGGSFYYNIIMKPGTKLKYDFTSSGSFIKFACNANGVEQDYGIEEPKWSGISYDEYKPKQKVWEDGYNEWRDKNNLLMVWEGYHDCRESLKHNINKIAEYATFSKQWLRSPSWLWLLHHGDTKKPGYNHNDITRSRLAKFPKDVLKAMGYEDEV